MEQFLYSGGFDFEIVDADLSTWNMDHGAIREIPDDTALLVVHNLGNIINVPALRKRFPKAVIVEDACEGLFGSYDGILPGPAR